MEEKTLDQIMNEIRPKLPEMGRTESEVIKLVNDRYFTPEEGHQRIVELRKESIKSYRKK